VRYSSWFVLIVTHSKHKTSPRRLGSDVERFHLRATGFCFSSGSPQAPITTDQRNGIVSAVHLKMTSVMTDWDSQRGASDTGTYETADDSLLQLRRMSNNEQGLLCRVSLTTSNSNCSPRFEKR
jgi:hypothetical protein